jgi:hypothetical protein
VVLKIISQYPTAVPISDSEKETALRLLVVPLAWLIQEFPPSIVFNIVPVLPTINPVSVSIKQIPLR